MPLAFKRVPSGPAAPQIDCQALSPFIFFQREDMMQATLFPGYSPKPRQDIVDHQIPGPVPSEPIVHARNRTLPAQDGRPQYSPMQYSPMQTPRNRHRSLAQAAGGSASASTASGSAPLFRASENENPEGLPPLMLAARNGDLRQLTALLAKPGTDIDQVDYRYGMSALMHAAQQGHVLLASALLDGGAAVNRRHHAWGHTALIIASARGYVDVARRLLRQPGIRVDSTDGRGWSALMHAADKNRPGVVACLLEAGAAVNLATSMNGTTALILATEKGHVDVVKLLLRQRDIELDQADASGDTALMVTARSGRADIVTCLLHAGAQANLANPGNGMTALITACAEGHLYLVNRLLSHEGIELDKTDDCGRSALIWAAMGNMPKLAACLLAAGASPSLVDCNGQSALAHAVQGGIPELVEVLVDHSIRPDEREFALRYLPGRASSFVAIADLCAAYRRATPASFHADDRMSFFRRLAAFWRNSDPNMDALQWLYDQGIRMACALQVDAALRPLHLRWQTQQSSLKQTLTLLLAILSRLPDLGGNAEVSNLYRDAGLSAAAVTRLSAVAAMQLTDLGRLAADTLASMAGEMLNSLVDLCLTMNEPDGQVDASALRTGLLAEGYCAPYAETIAVSWETAFTAFRRQPAFASGSTAVALPASAPQTQAAECASVLFARELRRQLGSRDCLTRLQSAPGGSDDEALHLLFQIQGDQLRQYCAQMLDTPTASAGPPQ